jgi:hypothetical protein
MTYALKRSTLIFIAVSIRSNIICCSFRKNSQGNKIKKQAFGDKRLKFSGHVDKTKKKILGAEIFPELPLVTSRWPLTSETRFTLLWPSNAFNQNLLIDNFCLYIVQFLMPANFFKAVTLKITNWRPSQLATASKSIFIHFFNYGPIAYQNRFLLQSAH